MIKSNRLSNNINRYHTMAQQQKSSGTPLAVDLIPEVTSWHLKAPVRSEKGGYSSYLVRRKGEFGKVAFQATSKDCEGKCVAPFGISKPYDATKEDSNKRNFELNIHSEGLHKFLETLDKFVEDEVVRNYETWFAPADDAKKKKRKALTPDDIRGMYRPLIQEGDKTKNYADIFRTKVYIEGKDTVRVFVYKGTVNNKPDCMIMGDMRDITPFVEVIPIIEIVGVWFMSTQYGLSLTTTDIVVYPKPMRPPGQFNFGGALPNIVAPSEDDLKRHEISDAMDIIPSEEASSKKAVKGLPANGRSSQGDSRKIKARTEEKGDAPPPTSVANEMEASEGHNMEDDQENDQQVGDVMQP